MKRKGNLEKAIKSYRKAGRHFTQSGLDLETARTYQQVGAIYQNQLQWDYALKAFKGSLSRSGKNER